MQASWTSSSDCGVKSDGGGTPPIYSYYAQASWTSGSDSGVGFGGVVPRYNPTGQGGYFPNIRRQTGTPQKSPQKRGTRGIFAAFTRNTKSSIAILRLCDFIRPNGKHLKRTRTHIPSKRMKRICYTIHLHVQLLSSHAKSHLTTTSASPPSIRS